MGPVYWVDGKLGLGTNLRAKEWAILQVWLIYVSFRSTKLHLEGKKRLLLLGDTPRVAAGFLKFNVKFESRKIKMIAWQHSHKKIDGKHK